MELMFLGTGAGKPSNERNVTALILDMMSERGTLWLFDCGEGTQHQCLKGKINPTKLEKIFITHLHGDHIFGLPGLLNSRSLGGCSTPLTLYGPKGLKTYLDITFSVSDSYLTYPLDIIEIVPGTVFEDDTFTVYADHLNHRIETFGFRITEHEKPGALDVQKLLADGIKPSALFQQLKAGKVVQLEDGRTVNGKDYLGLPKSGKVVTIFGDTRPTNSAVELARNADVIVHEATLEGSMAEKASEHGHSTTVQAATLAKESHAAKLIITHFSNRYALSDGERLLNECREIFPNTEIAEDFATFKI